MTIKYLLGLLFTSMSYDALKDMLRYLASLNTIKIIDIT